MVSMLTHKLLQYKRSIQKLYMSYFKTLSVKIEITS